MQELKTYKFRNAAIPLIYRSLLILLIAVVYGCREKLTGPFNDNSPPSIPTGLTVDGAFDGEVGLSWQQNVESDISGYKIYRSIGNDNNFKFLSTTSDNYYTDKGLEYDSTYNYKVSAFDKKNNESGLSLPVWAIPKNLYAPLPPTVVNINARNQDGEMSIHLSWDSSFDTDIAYYKVYRNTSSFENADSSLLIANVDGINYDDVNNLKLYQNYYYRISAVDKGNLKSSLTNSVSDYILGTPVLLSPPDSSEISDFSNFKIKTVGKPAVYKLVIQDNTAYGPVKEINFDSDFIDKEITVDLSGLQLEAYKTYFWRVLTYTNNNQEPNSYSGLFSFYYNPK